MDRCACSSPLNLAIVCCSRSGCQLQTFACVDPLRDTLYRILGKCHVDGTKSFLPQENTQISASVASGPRLCSCLSRNPLRTEYRFVRVLCGRAGNDREGKRRRHARDPFSVGLGSVHGH